LLILSKN